LGRRKRGWKAVAGFSLNDLRRLFEEKESQISKLTGRRDDLAAELAEVEQELAAAGGGARRGPGRPPKARLGRPPKAKGRRGRKARGPGRPKKGRRPGRPAGPKGQSELHQAIRGALRTAGKPLQLAEIAAKVKASGYKTKSKNFSVILGLRVSEMKDVKRVERGVYALK